MKRAFPYRSKMHVSVGYARRAGRWAESENAAKPPGESENQRLFARFATRKYAREQPSDFIKLSSPNQQDKEWTGEQLRVPLSFVPE